MIRTKALEASRVGLGNYTTPLLILFDIASICAYKDLQ